MRWCNICHGSRIVEVFCTICTEPGFLVSYHFGNVLSWSLIQPGVLFFSPCVDMATKSIAKRRHFGYFYLALAYNFSSIMDRALPKRVCSLTREGATSSRIATERWRYVRFLFDTGVRCGKKKVDSMMGCDRAAIQNSKTLENFGDHPARSRVVHR